jgi:SAM-dependent methyltransferase
LIKDDSAVSESDGVLRGYARDSATLIERYESLATEDVFAPVLQFVQAVTGDVLDVGAGTGRDAAWFSHRVRSVVAVEPVAAFRQFAGLRNGSDRITWLGDRLPGLEATLALGRQFDLITVVAVWHHLGATAGDAALITLRALARKEATVILSIREGAGCASRPVHPADVEKTVITARSVGFSVIKQVSAPSAQEGNRAAGVHWTWLVLRACAQSRTP